MAILLSVCFATLSSPPAPRRLRRNARDSAAVSPRLAATRATLALLKRSRSSATEPFFSSRFTTLSSRRQGPDGQRVDLDPGPHSRADRYRQDVVALRRGRLGL